MTDDKANETVESSTEPVAEAEPSDPKSPESEAEPQTNCSSEADPGTDADTEESVASAEEAEKERLVPDKSHGSDKWVAVKGQPPEHSV